MHEHIHRGDAHHGGVKVIAGKTVRFELVADRLLHQLIAVVMANPLGCVDQESCGTAGGVDDALAGGRAHQFHHQVDDELRSTELTIGAGHAQLREHVLVQIPHEVLVAQIEFVDQHHHRLQGVRVFNAEIGRAHVLRHHTFASSALCIRT